MTAAAYTQQPLLLAPSSTPNASLNQTLCLISKRFTAVYLPSVYLVVFLVGFVANVCGLYQMLQNWKKWTNINVFVLNLGIADLLYVVTLPFLVDYYVRGAWFFGDSFCRITRFLFHLNLHCSIAFLTCISVQRYVGIVHPMKVMGRLRLRQSVLISGLVWVWVIAQISPQLHFIRIDTRTQICYDTAANADLDRYRTYSFLISITGFVIPFLIILGCYSHVAAVLVRNNNVDKSLKQKCTRLVVIVTVLFSLCFMPYYIFRNLNLVARQQHNSARTCSKMSTNIYVAYQVTRGLASLNSAINPLVYLVTKDTFLSKVKNFSQRARQSIAYFSVRSIQSTPLQERHESVSAEA